MTDAPQHGVPNDPTQKLSPEQKEAVEVFVSTLPCWRTHYVPQLPSTIFEDNARFFTPVSLKKDSFPREPHWTWNRSNGTIVIDLYNQFRVKLTKYNSRRRKNSSQKQPSYKLWSYAVTVLRTNEKFAFIWCTKGKTRASRGSSNSASSDQPLVATREAPRAIQIHPSREQLRTYPTSDTSLPDRRPSTSPLHETPFTRAPSNASHPEREGTTPGYSSFMLASSVPQGVPPIVWTPPSNRTGDRSQFSSFPAGNSNSYFSEPSPAPRRSQQDVTVNFASSFPLPAAPCNQPGSMFGNFGNDSSTSEHPYGWI